MPARSQAQQRFMGMVHAEKEGKLDKSKLDPEFAAKIERIAASIKAKQARDFDETKHKDLPKKVKDKKRRKWEPRYGGMKKSAQTKAITKSVIKGVHKALRQKPKKRLLSNKKKTKMMNETIQGHGTGLAIGQAAQIPTPKKALVGGGPTSPLPKDMSKIAFKTSFMRHLARGLKNARPAAKTTTKAVQSTQPVVTKTVNPVSFTVKPLGSGHYNAMLGNKSIGGMSVNPVTKIVDDVVILKPFRKQGYGTKLYENVLRNEGGLMINPSTTRPGARAIWNNLGKKFPSMHGGQGVKWVDKNIIKQGSVDLKEKAGDVIEPFLPDNSPTPSGRFKKSIIKGIQRAIEPQTKLANHALDTAAVGATGGLSFLIPFAPLHAATAAARAPKKKKADAAKKTTLYGLAGNVPGMAYLGAKTWKDTAKARKVMEKTPLSPKAYGKYTQKVIKSLRKRGGKALALTSLGQAAGAAYGYNKAVKGKKKSKKSKKK